MNKRIYLKLKNGNYVAAGSKAELSPADVDYAVSIYNGSEHTDKMLYFDRDTGDVLLTDDVPEFMKGRLR